MSSSRISRPPPSGIGGQATEFLVVAATLLDLKTARLLPTAVVEDDEDIALLEDVICSSRDSCSIGRSNSRPPTWAELDAASAPSGRSVELDASFTRCCRMW